MNKPICIAYSGGKCVKWKVPGAPGATVSFAGRTSKGARDCVSHEIAKHCGKKRGKCKGAKARKQAVAIGFAVCRRKGFRSIRARR
jgi:hypothetical protein